RQRAERLALDHDHVAAHDLFDAHAVGGQLAVWRVVLAEREQRRVLVGRGDLGGGVHEDSGFSAPRPRRQPLTIGWPSGSSPSTYSAMLVGAGTGSPSALSPSM